MIARRRWRVCFCLAVLLAVPGSEAQEFRAFWVDAFHPGFKSAAEVSQLIADLRTANGNAVIVEVRKRADAYYNSNFEPKATDIASNFDPLQDLINKAHDTNSGPRIEVHAWIVTYPIWGSLSTNSLPAGHPLALHPDWLTHSNSVSGPTWNLSNYSFDPGHPEVQKHTFNVAMDIISRYDVDGLNFDYVRYAGNYWGYNQVTVNRFNARFGRTGEPSRSDSAWLQFRRDQVTSLVRKVYLSAITLKPQVKISADTICFAPGVTTDTGWTNSAAAYTTVLQDWRAWMEEGILDLNIPMMYFDHNVWASAWANWSLFAKDHRYNRHLAIGPGIYLNTVSNSLVQLRTTRVTTARGNRADGISGYSYAVPAGDGTSRATFFAALTQTNTSRLYETNPAPLFAASVSPPVLTWKTAPTRGHLKGLVAEAVTNRTLDGATMTLTGPTNRTFSSDATGFFGAVDLSPGSYTVAASFPGFFPRSTNVTVATGAVSQADLLLLPTSPALFINNVVAEPDISSAIIRWRTIVPATAQVEYGTTTNYGSVSPLDSIPVTNHAVLLSGLAADAAYFFRVVSRADTNTYRLGGFNFLTVPAPFFTNITVWPGARGAIITWQTSRPAGSQVEFGATAGLGSFSLLDPTAATNHSILLTGLLPDTSYFFRLISQIGTQALNSSVSTFNTAGQLIVDNPQATFSGSWAIGTMAGGYSSNYHFASTVAANASATATFTPNLQTPGNYDVYVWHLQGSNRATNAPFVVVYNGGSVTSIVDQTGTGSSGWRLIASGRNFARGATGFVRLGNGPAETGKVVIADAVRWVYAAGQEPPPAGSVPDWWARYYFGTNTVDATLDPDGDGYSTWAEFVLGTIPTDANSCLRFAVDAAAAPVRRIGFSPFYAGRIYQLQRRTDLSAGNWVTLSNSAASANNFGQASMTDTNGAAQSFYRLQIQLSP